MSRNVSLLASVSPKFTEETLETILRKTTGETCVKVTDWEFEPGAEEGSTDPSIVYRITVIGIVNNEPIRVPIIVKALPNNRCARKTFRSLEFSRNEINFYSKVSIQFISLNKARCEIIIVN